jgi:uncharacterized protein (TIGR02391 family)
MPVDRQRLKGLYGRLKGIQMARAARVGACPGTMGRDFNSIVSDVGLVLAEDMKTFVLPEYAFFAGGGGRHDAYCHEGELVNKLDQLISYLEFTQHVGAEIIEIGSLFNSIQDEALRARCADLLSAPGNFDRVVNQATLVLEDRIRAKAGKGNNLSGVPLVNEVLKTKLEESILKVSDDPGQHEGFCHICRGVMGAFRNPTHHRLVESMKREEALKVCAFIDNLLRVIDQAEVRQ